MITRLNIDHMTMIVLGVVAALLLMALSPAKAAGVDCQAQLETIRLDAASADPKVAAKAVRIAEVASKICVEGNRFEATKKFTQSRQLLDGNVQLAARR